MVLSHQTPWAEEYACRLRALPDEWDEARGTDWDRLSSDERAAIQRKRIRCLSTAGRWVIKAILDKAWLGEFPELEDKAAWARQSEQTKPYQRGAIVFLGLFLTWCLENADRLPPGMPRFPPLNTHLAGVRPEAASRQEFVAACEALAWLIQTTAPCVSPQLQLDSSERPHEAEISAILPPSQVKVDSKATASAADCACVFRCDGEVWALVFEGIAVHVPKRGAKGLAYIQQLLIRPEERVSVIELAETVSGDVRVRAASAAGEKIDHKGRFAMRARYVDVLEERDEAVKNNDISRAEKLQLEADAIAGELAASTGLDGRVRLAGDQVERLRSSVTNAMNRAIRAIADAGHKTLASHLDRYIVRGRQMCYTPPFPFDWAA